MTILVNSRYPDVVKACENDGIPLSKAFAKIVKNDDGSVEASFPLVKTHGGHIDVEENGDFQFDAGRVKAAHALGKLHHASSLVMAKIKNAAGHLWPLNKNNENEPPDIDHDGTPDGTRLDPLGGHINPFGLM